MLLEASHASLLLVDVQERLLPAMAEPDRVVAKCQVLLKAAEVLALPVTISEQYPKGLGPTVAGLQKNSAVSMQKTAFSCWRDDGLKSHFIGKHEAGRAQVIVAGIEAHVCVLQSCIDMAQAGCAVCVVADAVSSRRTESADLALDRMRMAGVQVVTTEMVVFELLEKAGTAEFRELSMLIK
jgi:nicotinamidase-related amidase